MVAPGKQIGRGWINTTAEHVGYNPVGAARLLCPPYCCDTLSLPPPRARIKGITHGIGKQIRRQHQQKHKTESGDQ